MIGFLPRRKALGQTFGRRITSSPSLLPQVHALQMGHRGASSMHVAAVKQEAFGKGSLQAEGELRFPLMQRLWQN